jgi:hypothetical protein
VPPVQMLGTARLASSARVALTGLFLSKIMKENRISNYLNLTRALRFRTFSVFISMPTKLKNVIFVGEIRGVVPRDAENKFRRLAMKKFGYGKGSLSKALEEALSAWIEKCEVEDSK